jgi:hypothetical protein
MNEKSNRYAIAALKARRAEIDGELAQLAQNRGRLENPTDAVVHLDASLALLDPTYDPASVRPKRLYGRPKLFGGRKLTGLILDALRRAERPLATQEAVSAVSANMNRGGGAPNVTKGVRMGLRYRGARRGRQRGSEGRRVGGLSTRKLWRSAFVLILT